MNQSINYIKRIKTNSEYLILMLITLLIVAPKWFKYILTVTTLSDPKGKFHITLLTYLVFDIIF